MIKDKNKMWAFKENGFKKNKYIIGTFKEFTDYYDSLTKIKKLIESGGVKWAYESIDGGSTSYKIDIKTGEEPKPVIEDNQLSLKLEVKKEVKKSVPKPKKKKPKKRRVTPKTTESKLIDKVKKEKDKTKTSLFDGWRDTEV